MCLVSKLECRKKYSKGFLFSVLFCFLIHFLKSFVRSLEDLDIFWQRAILICQCDISAADCFVKEISISRRYQPHIQAKFFLFAPESKRKSNTSYCLQKCFWEPHCWECLATQKQCTSTEFYLFEKARIRPNIICFALISDPLAPKKLRYAKQQDTNSLCLMLLMLKR